MHFCALGYSRSGEKPRPEGGATSDHWADVEKLAWEPEFFEYVRDAFAPVGLMIDAWAAKYPPGPGRNFPVVAINDLYESWQGTVRFRLLRDDKTIAEQTQDCEIPAMGSRKVAFAIDIPAQPGRYQVEAALLSPVAKTVRSLRDFEVSGSRKSSAPFRSDRIFSRALFSRRACPPRPHAGPRGGQGKPAKRPASRASQAGAGPR